MISSSVLKFLALLKLAVVAFLLEHKKTFVKKNKRIYIFIIQLIIFSICFVMNYDFNKADKLYQAVITTIKIIQHLLLYI